VRVAELLASGEVFATWDRQDSGCISYGLRRDDGRWFVKVPTHEQAAASLARASRLHAAVRHPAIIAPHDTATGDVGTALVYPWHDGEVLYDASARLRFRSLRQTLVEAALSAVIDAHLVVIAAGFVAVDLYDGCFLYDFDRNVMRLCDLDEYRPGPFRNEVGRLPGSKRFMSPEELTVGATIDERTTVFNLGRTIAVLLAPMDDEQGWRGTEVQRAVVAKATHADPARRYPTVAALAADWSQAAQTPNVDRG